MHDQLFPSEQPLTYGHVYATLARLLRDGLVEEAGVQPGDGPERKSYAITAAGVTDLDRWLSTPENPQTYLRSALYTKVVLAVLSNRSAAEIIDSQYSEHLRVMRALNRRKQAGDLVDQLICDHALLHLRADLEWLELAAARVADVANAVQEVQR